MDDSGLRRHDLEVPEGLLAPAEEGVALLVSLELELGVPGEREPARELVDLHGMVDHELGRQQRVDASGSPPELAHRVAHRGEIDDGGNAREVLQKDAGGRERDLPAGLVPRNPRRDRLDVRCGHRIAVLEPEDVLEQDAQRVREPADVATGLERFEPEDLVGLTADRESRAGSEAVCHR